MILCKKKIINFLILKKNSLQEAKVLESSRAARIIFVCEDSMILLVGFSRFYFL